MSELLFPFLVASVWATAGSLLLRAFFKADYSRITVFWLMSVFAFTFANQLALFQLLNFHSALLSTSLGAMAPIVAHLGFSHGQETEEPEGDWFRWVFGGLICTAAIVCAFGTASMLAQVAHLSKSSPASPIHLVALLTAVSALGCIGAATVLLQKRRGSSAGDAP